MKISRFLPCRARVARRRAAWPARDALPLTHSLFCLNDCNEQCTSDEYFLSTQHLFFKDNDALKCTKGDCGFLGCCESDAVARKDGDTMLPTLSSSILSLASLSVAASLLSSGF